MKSHSLLLSCIDRRLVEPHVEWMRKTGRLGNCYDLKVPGAILGLLTENKNSADRISLLKAIKLAVDDLHVNEIVLMNHTDCGAYKPVLAATMGNPPHPPGLERTRHLWDMQRAEKMLREEFPGVKVSTTLARISGMEVNIEDPPEI